MRDTIIKKKVHIKSNMFIYSGCLECRGTGIFDCGIPEMKGTCIQCKGTGIQYFGMM
ncbi:hypothetical protein [Lactonifactor sp. BIOML-A7]|uniref:hypothetical protein n=1 Tax=Lactonifactor sp. BIOML-A7 TaxID=2584660 RepID=UPI001563E5AD|nr:hypothetical protein [Lactonifactor sp. BIOML-A7]